MVNQSYYNDPFVRSRIIEFLGGMSIDSATACFISAGAQPLAPGYKVDNPRELSSYLGRKDELFRSLWDTNCFLLHLDVEYVNFDFPAEVYLDPVRAFDLQQPAVVGIQKVLLSFGISPLHVLTGRGHHFIWKIHINSPAFDKLVQLGYLSSHQKKTYAKPHPPDDEPVCGRLAKAFSGGGMVMEYVAHNILDEAADKMKIPLELTAVKVGQQIRGCEMVSLDISEYGDPLYTRSIRVPYSNYLKPWHSRGVITSDTVSQIPTLFLIPHQEFDINEGLSIMRNENLVRQLAQYAGVGIPDFTENTLTLIDRYMQSEVRKFHTSFYARAYHGPNVWADTYDKFSYTQLPKFAANVLNYPNDALLIPSCIRNLVRALISQDWAPHHIAGLIRSRYERDYGWGNQWYVYDASMRAEFYTRLFSGLLLCGRDKLKDFTDEKTPRGGLGDYERKKAEEHLRGQLEKRLSKGEVYE